MSFVDVFKLVLFFKYRHLRYVERTDIIKQNPKRFGKVEPIHDNN